MSNVSSVSEEHRHDLRVDPSQVIVMVGDTMRVRVRCAGCGVEAMIHSKPCPEIRLHDPKTWRPYRSKLGDLVAFNESR